MHVLFFSLWPQILAILGCANSIFFPPMSQQSLAWFTLSWTKSLGKWVHAAHPCPEIKHCWSTWKYFFCLSRVPASASSRFCAALFKQLNPHSPAVRQLTYACRHIHKLSLTPTNLFLCSSSLSLCQAPTVGHKLGQLPKNQMPKKNRTRNKAISWH